MKLEDVVILSSLVLDRFFTNCIYCPNSQTCEILDKVMNDTVEMIKEFLDDDLELIME